jgi:hypothetical protein
MQTSFHRRELQPPAVAFSSPQARSYFEDALSSGHAEGYFALAEQFQSQSHYAFCGITSLSMALNTMLIDPGRVWQGVWRWFEDSMLDCCEPLAIVREKGIVMSKLACLARCNGAACSVTYALDSSLARFRTDLLACTVDPDTKTRPIMVACYGRKELNQTGTGHFSPIAAYAPASDMVLVMDVARFKYPPYWVPATALFHAMRTTDPDAGSHGASRGYLLLTRGADIVRVAEGTEDCCCAEFDTGTGAECSQERQQQNQRDVLKRRLEDLCKHACADCNDCDHCEDTVCPATSAVAATAAAVVAAAADGSGSSRRSSSSGGGGDGGDDDSSGGACSRTKRQKK